jgi:hypothetical protein
LQDADRAHLAVRPAWLVEGFPSAEAQSSSWRVFPSNGGRAALLYAQEPYIIADCKRLRASEDPVAANRHSTTPWRSAAFIRSVTGRRPYFRREGVFILRDDAAHNIRMVNLGITRAFLRESFRASDRSKSSCRPSVSDLREFARVAARTPAAAWAAELAEPQAGAERAVNQEMAHGDTPLSDGDDNKSRSCPPVDRRLEMESGWTTDMPVGAVQDRKDFDAGKGGFAALRRAPPPANPAVGAVASFIGVGARDE